MHARIQRGRPAPEKSQNIGFRSKTGPDPLKIIKLPSQQLMLGHHPFERHFAGGPMMVCLKWYLDPPSPNKLKKNILKVGAVTSSPEHVLLPYL